MCVHDLVKIARKLLVFTIDFTIHIQIYLIFSAVFHPVFSHMILMSLTLVLHLKKVTHSSIEDKKSQNKF